jgi:hypothetical protein
MIKMLIASKAKKRDRVQRHHRHPNQSSVDDVVDALRVSYRCR